MNRHPFLTFSFVIAVAFFSPALAYAALVAQYDFEGNVNDTTATYHGTFNGGAAVYGTGRFGSQAIDLDGVNDFVSTTNNANLGLTGSFSVTAWVYGDVLTTGGCCAHDYTILGNDGPNANNEQLHLVVRSQQQHMGFFGDDLGPNALVTPGHWYHMAWTYDAATNQQAMYLNGAPNGTRVAGNDLVNGAKTANIGQWNGGAYWNGRIDQLKVYNNTLTAAQVNAEAAGTLLKYNFDGNTNDSSGNDYHGTVTGTAQYGAGLSGGNSFDFDGSTSVSTGQQAVALGLTGAGWTASAKINGDVFTGDRTVFGQDGGATNQTLHLVVRNGTDTGNVPKAWFGQYSNDTGGSRQLETGHTYDIAWRYNNGEQAIFVNGILDGSSGGKAPLVNTANNVLVGQWNGGNRFDGRIDDATIQNTAASVADIQAAAALNVSADERFSASIPGNVTTGMRARKVNGSAGDLNASQANLVGGSLPGDGVGLFSSVNMSSAGQGLFAGGTNFPGGGGDNFSTEVTGLLYVPAPGIYVLGARADDSVRIQIGKSLITLDEFGGTGADNPAQRTVNFAAAGYYPYRLIHREVGGDEHLEFYSGTNVAGAIDVGGGATDLINDTANGGMRSIATGSFLVRDVKSSGTINSIASAESLLSGTGVSSTTTGFYSVIDFKDSGAGGDNFGINLAFPGGQNRDDYAVEATTNIWITEAGTYTFGFNSDDGGKLTVNGMDIIIDDALHGLEDRFGQINFAQAGFYSLRYLFFERGGGSGMELFASKGSHTSFGSAGAAFRLLGDVGNGGIAVFIPEPTSLALFACAMPLFLRRRRR